MRLDKYLKVSRLVKRRTLAKEVADKGRIEINGKTAKSSSVVGLGDELTLYYGNRILKVRVTDIKDSTKKQDAAFMYEIVSEERIERPALDEVTGIEIFE
ncbi:MAG: RNA-binding S4 domain-containing protein [Turicibacter sp.]